MTRYYDAGDIDLDEDVVLDSKGNRIDEARASEMAEHALRTAGRPSLSRRGTSPEVKARVPEALRQALLERARREHKRPSTVIREALEVYLQAS